MPQADSALTTPASDFDPFALGGTSPFGKPALGLPFVFDRRPDHPEDVRRRFWCVMPTGDYSADCATGEQYARDYVRFEQADRGGAGLLQLIVGDMPRELSGIEIAFLATVSAVIQRSNIRLY